MDFSEELQQVFETLYGEENLTSSGFEQMGTGEEHTDLPPAVPAPAAAPTPPLPPDTAAPNAPSAPPVTPAPAAPPLLPITPSPPLSSLSTDTVVTYVTLLSPIMSVISIHTHPLVTPVTPVIPVTPVTPVPAVPQAAAQAKPPYVKKPPNAFMLFRKEQRPNVVTQHRVRDCATVNKILGEIGILWQLRTKKSILFYQGWRQKGTTSSIPGGRPTTKSEKGPECV